ncbi:MAG: peptidase, partial [Coleofasciculaceae cyanobacterium SM2_3_26]|nr:peptidase [Coleofasciculaceae cyanobacterium SM2_3_26]
MSPVADKMLLSNHRQELLLVDLSEKTCTVLDRSEYNRIAGFCWSPDGRWAAYGCAASHNTCSIKVCEVASGEIHVLTPPRFYDMDPSFDPEGKYLYFLSVREFNPVYDSIYFDLNFPRGMRPCAIALRSDVPSPFIPVPKPLKDSGKSENGKKSEGKQSEDSGEGSNEGGNGDASNGGSNGNQPTPVEIEFEGCDRRIVAFPVAEGRYRQIYGIKGKVLFSSVPVEGSLGRRWSNAAPNAKATLEYYDFAEQKTEKVATEVTSFDVGRDGETLIYRSGNALRICAIAPKSDKSNDTEPGRKSGWLDLQRVRVGIEPGLEWRQMFGEIWRLQKEQFWTPDMSDVNWER